MTHNQIMRAYLSRDRGAVSQAFLEQRLRGSESLLAAGPTGLEHLAGLNYDKVTDQQAAELSMPYSVTGSNNSIDKPVNAGQFSAILPEFDGDPERCSSLGAIALTDPSDWFIPTCELVTSGSIMDFLPPFTSDPGFG